MKKLFFKIYLLIFSNNFFYRLNKALAITGLKGMGILNYESFGASGEENFLKTLAGKINPKVIFDVGANTGSYSKICSSRFPRSIIYAFEPHPGTFLKLKQNVDSPNIRTFNLGLSDKPGQLELFDYADMDGSSHASLHEESLTKQSGKRTVSHSVQMSTIQDFMNENNISQIDFLKIDTEGHELKVLRGAGDAILNDKIQVIQFEFGRPDLASRTFFRDIYDLLNPKYNIYRLLPSSLLPVKSYHYLFNEIFAFQNYVAFHK